MTQRNAAATVSLVRRGAVLLVALVGLVFSVRRLGTPAQEVERSGWLFQHYGAQGVSYGMIALTASFTLVAAILTWRAWLATRE